MDNNIFFIMDEYHNKSIKKILEKLLQCNIYCLSDIENLVYNELPYYFNQRLSLYKKGLDLGCNIILNFYDHEILDTLKENYNFIEYKITNNLIKNYKIVKQINNKINIFKYIRYSLYINIIVYFINNIQKYITSNIGYEISKGNFIRIKNKIDNDFSEELKLNIILKKYFYYKKRLQNIILDKPKKCLNVGVFSNRFIPNKLFFDYNLENILSTKNMICIRQFNNISKLKQKYYSYKIKKYCKYNINNALTRNINDILKGNYDGIIYVTEKGNVLDDISYIIIENICDKKKIPLVNINFDENINILNIENKINMLNDLININNIGQNY